MGVSIGSDATGISRRRIIVALSALQAVAIAALALRKPHLAYYVLVLPVLACFAAFQMEAQRLALASGGGRLIDWLGRMWIGIIVYDVLVSVWFLLH